MNGLNEAESRPASLLSWMECLSDLTRLRLLRLLERHELYGTRFPTAALLSLLPDDWVVADLGCGTGQTAVELAAHVRRVIAVDNSAAMLKAARKRAEGTTNVDLRRGDLAALPIDDGECDAALILLGLTYVADPPAVLREARRVLRPGGGRLAVVDLLPHD